jgi:hypothetical protein
MAQARRLLTPPELDEFAQQALLTLVQERGAVVFPEAYTILGQDQDWLRQTLPEFPYPRFDLHVVRRARRALLATGGLAELPATLQGQVVKALVHGPSYRDRGARTEVTRAAATKRKIYRTYLSWTSNPARCGHVAERIVVASMRAAEGLYGVPKTHGNVRAIERQAIEGSKTLDATASAVVDLERPSQGSPPVIPIGVEVKNVRQTLYPSSTEVWDLLTKLRTFPNVVPILICRQAHITLFRMFADLGAAAFYTSQQVFSPSVPGKRFNEVTRALGFRDARRVADPDRPSPAMTGFFVKNLRAPRTEEPADPRPLIVRSQEKWRIASEIVDDFVDLAEESQPDDHREELLNDFRAAVEDAEILQIGGW